MQAADALSLADGPCKLTCADFFREMTEQAQVLKVSMVVLKCAMGCFRSLRGSERVLLRVGSCGFTARYIIGSRPREGDARI